MHHHALSLWDVILLAAMAAFLFGVFPRIWPWEGPHR
jgi:hypothetical protein